MRENATVRIGLAMAAGAVLAGCAATSPSASAPASSTAPASPTEVSPAVSQDPSPVPESTPASPAPGTPAPSKPGRISPSALPTITKPAKPPREPTDNLPSTGWVAGMVTRGGTGPCYGLIADDGTRYALYSTTGVELTKGARVKVLLETTQLRIYCGAGTLMAMTDSEPIK